MLIHEPVKNRTSWDVHAIEGHHASPALHYYRNFTVFSSKTRASRVSNAVKFHHAVVTAPKITPEDKVIHAMSKLKSELASIPAPNTHDQIEAMPNLRNLFSKHSKSMKNPNETIKEVHVKKRKRVISIQGCLC